MMLTIVLTPEEAARLSEAAMQAGVAPEEMAQKTLTAALPVTSETNAPDAENLALMKLIQSWREEDATDDPEELDRRDRDLEEFKANMNANRITEGRPPVYP